MYRFLGKGSCLLVLLIVMGWIPLTAVARPEASAVTYTSGMEQATGYLVRPAGAGPFPGLVVIHEWWGLNDQIKGTAEALAREGYVALAVDLYRGRVTADASEAHELMRGLPEDQAIRDLKAAVEYLRGRPDVQGDRIGSIGWCMGGRILPGAGYPPAGSGGQRHLLRPPRHR